MGYKKHSEYMKAPEPPKHEYEEEYTGVDDTASYGEEEQDQLRFQLDVKPILLDFERRVLRGQYESVDAATGDKRWVLFDSNSKPIINEIGIREVLGRLFGYCNIATKLSYYSETEIYKNLFYFDMSLTELIAKRADYWELDIETAKLIKDSCIELVQSILFSARNGFTAINLRTTYSRSEVMRADSGQQNGKSFMGIPLGGNRN